MHDIGGTATVTQPTAGQSISCQDTEYWAPTVSNWAEEGVDAKLSSWALNLVSHPPTAIPSGSYPTLLPQIFTGFGNTSQYQAIGIAGQLMSIANSGMDASCNLLDGPNGQCPPITVQQACKMSDHRRRTLTYTFFTGGKMPRWAYLAWTAIYNMFSIHTAINVEK